MHYSKNMWKFIYLVYKRRVILWNKEESIYYESSTTIPGPLRTRKWPICKFKTKEKKSKYMRIRNKICGYPLYLFFPSHKRFRFLKKKNYLIRNKLSLWKNIVNIMRVSPLRGKKKKKGGKKKK